MHAYKQKWLELSLQVSALEATGQTEERDYFPDLRTTISSRLAGASARQAKLEKNAAQSQKILSKCEGYCQQLRHVLRRQEDLETQACEMYALDHSNVETHDAVQGGTCQLGNVGERSVFWRELSTL